MEKHIFASIAQVVADNLGLHQLFSLKANFIGDNICHLCDAIEPQYKIILVINYFIKKLKISIILMPLM